MRLHHHAKHGLLKLASLAKGKIRIPLLIITFLVISYFAVSHYLNRGFTQTPPQQTLGAQTLAALNLHPLASDEFAIVSKSIGNPTGKKVTRTMRLSNGATYTASVDENTTTNLIEGSDNTVTYVKMSDAVEIHEKSET